MPAKWIGPSWSAGAVGLLIGFCFLIGLRLSSLVQSSAPTVWPVRSQDQQSGGKALSFKGFKKAEKKPASPGAPFVGFGQGCTFSDFDGAAGELFEKVAG